MTRSSTTFRAYVSALLLVLQVLGLGHVALARHTVNETGALVDVEPLLFDSHDEQESHVCAEDVEIHADAPGDCLVAATWKAPAVFSAPAVLHRTTPAQHHAHAPPAAAVAPLEVLAFAPKASPPRG